MNYELDENNRLLKVGQRYSALLKAVSKHYFQEIYYDLNAKSQEFLINNWIFIIDKEANRLISIHSFMDKYKLRLKLAQP